MLKTNVRLINCFAENQRSKKRLNLKRIFFESTKKKDNFSNTFNFRKYLFETQKKNRYTFSLAVRIK